jgi:hypothetical protein
LKVSYRTLLYKIEQHQIEASAVQSPLFFGSSSGAHTVSGTASVQHPLGEHLTMRAEHTRIEQIYGEIAAISAFPNTNRDFVSSSYRFTTPLKR